MKVSICIPTYNSSIYLVKSLNSIIAQDYSNIEILISDNYSTDGTKDILAKYEKSYSIKVFYQDENIGYLKNWNFLLNQATGDLVSIYHADDVYHQSIVSKSVNAFEKHKNISIVSTLGNTIDSNGHVLSNLVMPNSLKKNNEISFSDCFNKLLNTNELFLITPSVMIRRKDLLNKRFKSWFRSACDYALWLEILYDKGNLFIVDECLIQYRFHSNQLTESCIVKDLKIPDSVRVYSFFASKDRNRYWIPFLKKKAKLLFIQAFKLNNISNFSLSQKLTRIVLRDAKYLTRLKALFLLVANCFRLRISLDYLVKIKKIMK